MPVPSWEIVLFGKIAGQRFGFSGKLGTELVEVQGVGDRHYRNFATDVAEGKTRRHVRSKTPASRAVRMMSPSHQALFCEPLPRLTDV